MKSCFEGYLTEQCKNCPDWRDGTDGTIGCATHYPIDLCPHFAKMYKEEEKKKMAEGYDFPDFETEGMFTNGYTKTIEGK